MKTSYSRREFVIGTSLLVTAGAAEALVPSHNMDLLGKERLEDGIPKMVGPWAFISVSGLITPPPDQLRDQLYAQIVTRVYSADGLPPIMLLVAQSPGQDGMLQIHRPEICYPAGGYRLTNFRRHEIVLGPARTVPTRAFTAVGESRTEQLLYWTRIGHDLPTDWLDQRLAVAKANLRGEIPDAILVRISTVSNDPDVMPALDQFTRELIGASSPRIRAVLLGPANSAHPAA